MSHQEVIKKLIKDQGLKCNYLSKMMGIHHVTMSKFLNNKINLKQDKLNKLYELLGGE